MEINVTEFLNDENLLNEYEIFDVLGFTRSRSIRNNLINFFKETNIDYIYFENGLKEEGKLTIYYLFCNKKQLHNFLSNHTHQKEIQNKYQYKNTAITNIIKSNNLKKYSINIRDYYVRNDDVEKYFNKENIFNDLLTFDDVKNVLSIEEKDKPLFYLVQKDFNIETIRHGRNVYYKKPAIDNLFNECEKIRKVYCLGSKAAEILGVERVRGYDFAYYPITNIAKLALYDREGSKRIYKLEEIYKYKNEKEMKEIENDLRYSFKQEEAFDSFLKLLELKGLSFHSKSLFTKNKWLEYVKQKFQTSQARELTLQNLMTTCLILTEKLIEFLQDKELYSFNSKQINLFFFNDSISKRNQDHFLFFLNQYHKEIKIYLLENNITNKRIFDINKINKPIYDKNKDFNDVFSFEEYKKIYDYCNQLEFHKINSIDDSKIIFSNIKKAKFYASGWLYSLILLCNAWRHGDVVNLPIIDIRDISIKNLDGLLSVDLNETEVSKIINRFKNRVLIANKTGAELTFQCPSDLEKSLATAIFICSYIQMERFPLSDIQDINLVDFYTKTNKEFVPKSHNAFYEKIKLDKFSFKSRKMNRTLLVLMHSILSKEGNGSAALKIAQRLRSHYDFETTNIYLEIPENELEELTKTLFNRKPFGFISKIFTNLLTGNIDSRNEETFAIETVNNTFGDNLHLEVSSGFLNKVISERTFVSEYIYSLGFEEAREKFFDINTNSLPSNDKNYQCLFSGDCKRPELESCSSCPFAIPNYFALNSLVNNLKDSIREFSNNFNGNSYEGEKTKLINNVYMNLDYVENAIQEFGRDNVFSFLEGGEEEYNNLIGFLDIVQNKEIKDLESYVTYELKYIE